MQPRMESTMPKALVIEDDHHLAGLIKEYFKVLDIDVEIDYNPMSGLRHLKTNKYDLLLTDVNMTPISGYELIHEVRAFNKNMKIIAMSGSYTEESKSISHAMDSLNRAGMDAYLPKPFTITELENTLKKLELIS
jgi:DNA-binding response OmpR family regulator